MTPNLSNEDRLHYDPVVILLLISCAFTKHITPFIVAFSDILFALGITIALLRLISKNKILVPSWSLPVILIWVWATIPLLEYQNRSYYFEINEFLFSYLKLIFYSSSAMIAWSYLSNLSIKNVIRSTHLVLVFLFCIGLYATINGYLDSITGFSLPYNFIWMGQGDEFKNYIYSGFELNPFKSFFQEGSHYARFVLIMLFFILIKDREYFQNNLLAYILIFSTVFLTFSLTAFALGFLVFALALSCFKDQIYKIKFSLSPKTIVVIFISIIPIFFLSEFIIGRIFGRSLDVLAGNDRSSLYRFVVTYQTTFFSLDRFPLTGSGLGHPSLFFDSFAGNAILTSGLLETTEASAKIHILYAYIAASMGIPGLIFGLTLISSTIKGIGFKGFLLFFISLFATGMFLETMFWVQLIFLTLKKNE